MQKEMTDVQAEKILAKTVELNGGELLDMKDGNEYFLRFDDAVVVIKCEEFEGDTGVTIATTRFMSGGQAVFLTAAGSYNDLV